MHFADASASQELFGVSGKLHFGERVLVTGRYAFLARVEALFMGPVVNAESRRSSVAGG